jgi:hypothetical protein
MHCWQPFACWNQVSKHYLLGPVIVGLSSLGEVSMVCGTGIFVSGIYRTHRGAALYGL